MLQPFLSMLEASATKLVSRPANLSPLADRRRNPRFNEVRRRPGRAQGRALEILAHALEYLVDNGFEDGSPAWSESQDAVRLIAEKSRAVFAECPEITTWSQRFTRTLPRFLTLPAIDDAAVLSRIHRSSDGPPRVSRDDE